VTEQNNNGGPEGDPETTTELSFDEADKHIREQATLQREKKGNKQTADFNRVQRNIWDHNRRPTVGTSRAYRNNFDRSFGRGDE
jgi:hypothetical protein